MARFSAMKISRRNNIKNKVLIASVNEWEIKDSFRLDAWRIGGGGKVGN